MKRTLRVLSALLALLTLTTLAAAGGREGDGDGDDRRGRHERPNVQVGVRPFYLVEGMDDSALKDRLKQCEAGPFYTSRVNVTSHSMMPAPMRCAA